MNGLLIHFTQMEYPKVKDLINLLKQFPEDAKIEINDVHKTIDFHDGNTNLEHKETTISVKIIEIVDLFDRYLPTEGVYRKYEC